jgi:UTP--glucose-1-phosphate uridylyltransferase
MPELKAVVSTAGFGTRMFPVTAAVNKSLLPVGNRPVIDYLLSELVAAGVTEVAIVTMPGDGAIRRYVEPAGWIEKYFHSRGWDEKYAPVAELRERFGRMRFCWIEQPLDGRYGTAIPPLLAREFVGNSDWLLLTGDDVVLRPDGGSDLADLIAARTAADVPAAIQVTELPEENLSRYGIIRTKPHPTVPTATLFDGAVEKPAPGYAASNLASISRFLLRPDFFDYLAALTPDPINNEYLSITALAKYAADNSVLVHPITGTYHDCGNITGLLGANLEAAEIARIRT